MILKKVAVLFVASFVLAPSVSAGSVRGVVRENENREAHKERHRFLKDQGNVASNPVVPTPSPAPPAPVAPPTPSPFELFVSSCSTFSISISIQNCAGTSLNGCLHCLYGQTLLSSSGDAGVSNCAKFLCDGCIGEAKAFYSCATKQSNPVLAPVTSPVSDSSGGSSVDPIETPPLVVDPIDPPPQVDPPAPTIDDVTTAEGCPATKPTNGAACTIPKPFLYHKCFYAQYTCQCRHDSSFYLCNKNPNGLVVDPSVPVPSVPVDPVKPAVPVEPATPVDPVPPQNPVVVPPPTVGITTGDASECSDIIVSGVTCSAVSTTCCVGGESFCTCGSDKRFVCQQSVCGVNVPSGTKPAAPIPVPVAPPVPTPITVPVISSPVPVPSGVSVATIAPGAGIPIPSTVDFSLKSTWCPRTIANCDPCAEFLPSGDFEGACTAPTTVDYLGLTYQADIQCRCFTQDNPNPVWECRYIGGTLGTVTVPVSPACAPASQPGTDIGVAPSMIPDQVPANPVVVPSNPNPEIITSIPLTKVCLNRLPTSGLSKCDLPPNAICCHNVQFGIATVCTCENNLFQCRNGIPGDCPDGQNPNVIPIIDIP